MREKFTMINKVVIKLVHDHLVHLWKLLKTLYATPKLDGHDHLWKLLKTND